LTIASAAPVDDGPGWRLGFREVRDRAAADQLREAYLEIVVDREAELAPGEAFWHEVIGAEVLGSNGRSLGRVADVYRAGEAEVYVVQGGPSGEFDLPAVRSVITSFDPRGAGIVVDEAALDLAAPPVDSAAKQPRKAHRWSRHGKGGPSAPPAGEPERGGEAS
jgi:16S rRNA processing protein RimM